MSHEENIDNELITPSIDDGSGMDNEGLRTGLAPYDDDELSQSMDEISRMQKRRIQLPGDKAKQKRARTQSEFMHVAQQLVAACLPMAGRISMQADGSLPALFDISSLPFALPPASTSNSLHNSPSTPPPLIAEAADEAQDDRKHECEVCFKRYKHRTHLTRHMRTHTGEKPFSCHLCTKSFGRREYLSMHLQTHASATTDDVKFLKCDQCDKKFTRLQVLTKHMEFHSPARRFPCATCGLRFKTAPSLAAHVAVHASTRSYTCSICAKGFKSSTALKAHEVVHTGEKKFACTECSKSFNNLSSLHKHALVHSEDSPYKCEVCFQTFKYSSNFTRHLRQHLPATGS